MGDLIDSTLSNAVWFYSSKGDNLAAKGLKLSLNPITAMGDLIDSTLSNARWFYSSTGDNLAAKGFNCT